MPQAVACVSLVLLCPPVSSEVYRLRTATISDQLYTNLHQFYSCDLMNRRTLFYFLLFWTGWGNSRQKHCLGANFG